MAPAQWKFDACGLVAGGTRLDYGEADLSAASWAPTSSRATAKVTTVLTIQPKDKNGNQRWELADGATLYDVTHLGMPLRTLHAGDG